MEQNIFKIYSGFTENDGREVDTYPIVKPLKNPINVRTEPKISRNAPCICGSGKKYKHCCIK
jgi:uncharacterized protein YecA (UPF0149 family)